MGASLQAGSLRLYRPQESDGGSFSNIGLKTRFDQAHIYSERQSGDRSAVLRLTRFPETGISPEIRQASAIPG